MEAAAAFESDKRRGEGYGCLATSLLLSLSKAAAASASFTAVTALAENESSLLRINCQILANDDSDTVADFSLGQRERLPKVHLLLQPPHKALAASSRLHLRPLKVLG